MLGRSFALGPELLRELTDCADDDARTAWIVELEEEHDDALCLSFDKDWEELHRALGDGKLFLADDGPPVAQAVFGSEPVYGEDSDEFAGLLPAGEVAAVVRGLDEFGEQTLRRRLGEIDRDMSPDLAAGIVATFHALRAFLGRAAEAGHAVLFTVM